MSSRSVRQAFPSIGGIYDGLTLKEYYAGQAMAGLLANSEMANRQTSREDLASKAVGNAEALLAELEKGATDAV